ncbi:MAG: hypothetical protein OEM85_10630 [Gammaproteobacteria bacterium]|nr:hypothetical protein [Gammaproteobacteria bacterium]MDH3409444.1 hypothetical protein [Gammaproteobacteria bacterium]
MKIKSVVALLIIAGAYAPALYADDLAAEVDALRALLFETRQNYEKRISDLEARLARTEQIASSARRDASEAFEIAEQTAIDQTSGAAAANTFNPSAGAVLFGRYANVDQTWEEIPGFLPAGEIGTGESGFSLGEAEINLKANVDDRFFGNLTFALADESGEVEVELEEAWVQSTGLPAGLGATGGRFFSAAGYLNQSHRHTDDFADRPLPYQAFFGGQYRVDGVQVRWIAPTPLLLELGGELNWGGGFPATGNAESSPGAHTLFAKIGGDVGASNSWQAGLAWLSADVIESGDTATFSGDSDMTIFDVVWKWAPNGNSASRNFKIQGEYFRRDETGIFDGIAYDGEQTGWYLQSVWQFAPRWRVGVRHDAVNADNGPLLAGTELEDPGRRSSRDSLMLDWSPSEFSRLRLQYTNDQVLSATDQQWFLQYIMSIGAHGAHAF